MIFYYKILQACLVQEFSANFLIRQEGELYQSQSKEWKQEDLIRRWPPEFKALNWYLSISWPTCLIQWMCIKPININRVQADEHNEALWNIALEHFHLNVCTEWNSCDHILRWKLLLRSELGVCEVKLYPSLYQRVGLSDWDR